MQISLVNKAALILILQMRNCVLESLVVLIYRYKLAGN